MHKADEPDALADLGHADVLPGKRVTEIHLLSRQANPAAVGCPRYINKGRWQNDIVRGTLQLADAIGMTRAVLSSGNGVGTTTSSIALTIEKTVLTDDGTVAVAVPLTRR